MALMCCNTEYSTELFFINCSAQFEGSGTELTYLRCCLFIHSHTGSV